MPDRLRSTPKRLSGSGPAPSVGFLIDRLEDSRYHWRILRGAMKEAYDRGANFVCFVGGALLPPDQPSDSNWVYDLARPPNVDALVLLSGSLGNAAGSEALASFCTRYPPMPICSLAIPLPRMSSVCIDNAAGMRAVVDHLVQSHGIRRIAFVRGPAANDEAELRLRIYREALDLGGITYAPELVVPGDFTASAGYDAVTTLFVERKLPVDAVGAIVAANDAMAMGVVDGLSGRGIRIPEQIAVAGFDDIEEARFCVPPLTTVSQRIEDQGRECVRIVLDQLRRGAIDPEHVVRKTELMARRSCGCLASVWAARASSAPPAANLSFDSALLRRRQHILTDMARAARGALGAAGAQWEARLLNAVAEQVRGDSADAFVRAYDDLLGRVTTAGGNPSVCNDVLSALRSRVVRCIGDPKRRMHAEDFFHEARVLTANAVERAHVMRRLRAWSDARSVVQAGSAAVAAGTLDALSQVARDHLPRAGIPRSYVARLSQNGGDAAARIVLAERPDARKSDPALSASHPASKILREMVLNGTDEHAFAVFPATLGRREKALVILELGALEGYSYEVVRQAFASALARMDPEPDGRAS